MKVVGIGGGHGLAITLRAARMYADDVAAVVTVADDGGSSGRLTSELGIPPPGDIRNCLVALADGGPLADMFQHRFQQGTLEGHPIGNLVIAALAEMSGDFASAVEEAGRLLGSDGHVYPATTELVRLSAVVEGGVVQGQVAVAQTKAPIHSVHLVPSAPEAHPAAVEAIRAADQIVIGPGSLFTSLIATLLVPGIRDALADTAATKVFVCNARIQKGETEGMDVAAHVEALLVHAGIGSINTVVLQDPPLADAVPLADESWRWPEIEVVRGDVADDESGHDPVRLAKVLASLVR
jgi:uncharacterized cofD-like protein